MSEVFSTVSSRRFQGGGFAAALGGGGIFVQVLVGESNPTSGSLRSEEERPNAKALN
jgi:hypothetical protein